MNLPVPPRPDASGAAELQVGRPKATWHPLIGIGIWFAATVGIGGIFAAIFASSLDLDDVSAGADADVLLVSALGAIATVGCLWWWLHTKHPTWPAVMGVTRDRDALRHLGWGAVAGVLLYPAVAFGAGLIVIVVLERVAGATVEAPDQLAPGLAGVGRVLAVVYGIGIAPVAEEFFFRGVLFRSIADRWGFWLGAIVSAALFGLVHWPPGSLPLADALVLPLVMTCTGIGLAWICERRQSVLAPIGAHMAFNAIGLFLVFVVPVGAG